MPGRLMICGCLSLPIAADDLAMPSVFGGVLRSFALVIAIILTAIGLSGMSCQAKSEDITFFATTLATLTFSLAMYYVLYRVTSTGTMLEWEKRNYLTYPILYTLGFLYCVELATAIFGIVRLTNPQCPISSEVSIIEIIMIIAIFIDFFTLFCVIGILLYISKGKKPRPLTAKSYEKTLHELFCGMEWLCCGFFGTLESPGNIRDLAWSEISYIIHNFLKDTLVDLTLTDIFAAILLLRAEQRIAEASRVREALSTPGLPLPKPGRVRFKEQSLPSSTPITPQDVEAMKSLQDFDDYADYAIGIFGWNLQLYMDPLSFIRGLPTLVTRRVINGTELNLEAFKSVVNADSKKTQILYSSFTSYLGEAIPYAIVADHEKKAIVITLRGTGSVGDIATDLLCTPVRLGKIAKQWGLKEGAENHYVHGGMLEIANRIRTDIEKQQILHRLLKVPVETLEEQKARESYGSVQLTEDDRESFLKAAGLKKRDPLPEGLMYGSEVFIDNRSLSNMNCSGYKLICCGISLGSCMAAILSLLLRPRFPNIKCLAYSCVSAIFSKDLAEESKEWVTCVTVGKDIFGRLNWHSAKDLFVKLLDVIRRSKTNKSTIYLNLLRKRPLPIDTLLYPRHEVPDDPLRQNVARIIDRYHEENNDTLDQIHMYMPGKIIYFEKTHTEVQRGCLTSHTQRHYSPVWVDDRSQLQELFVSTRMLLDHMPDHVLRLIRRTITSEQAATVNIHKKKLIAGTVDV